MRIQGFGKVRGAGADGPDHPVPPAVAGQATGIPTSPVDLEALRTIGWNPEPDPVVVPIAAPRLRRAGLVQRTAGGTYRLTPEGVDLLDDDF